MFDYRRVVEICFIFEQQTLRMLNMKVQNLEEMVVVSGSKFHFDGFHLRHGHVPFHAWAWLASLLLPILEHLNRHFHGENDHQPFTKTRFWGFPVDFQEPKPFLSLSLCRKERVPDQFMPPCGLPGA